VTLKTALLDGRAITWHGLIYTNLLDGRAITWHGLIYTNLYEHFSQIFLRDRSYF